MQSVEDLRTNMISGDDEEDDDGDADIDDIGNLKHLLNPVHPGHKGWRVVRHTHGWRGVRALMVVMVLVMRMISVILLVTKTNPYTMESCPEERGRRLWRLSSSSSSVPSPKMSPPAKPWKSFSSSDPSM